MQPDPEQHESSFSPIEELLEVVESPSVATHDEEERVVVVETRESLSKEESVLEDEEERQSPQASEEGAQLLFDLEDPRSLQSDDMDEYWPCSNCHNPVSSLHSHCPQCGGLQVAVRTMHSTMELRCINPVASLLATTPSPLPAVFLDTTTSLKRSVSHDDEDDSKPRKKALIA